MCGCFGSDREDQWKENMSLKEPREDMSVFNTESLREAIELLENAMASLSEAGCLEDYQRQCSDASDVIAFEIDKLREILKKKAA